MAPGAAAIELFTLSYLLEKIGDDFPLKISPGLISFIDVVKTNVTKPEQLISTPIGVHNFSNFIQKRT